MERRHNKERDTISGSDTRRKQRSRHDGKYLHHERERGMHCSYEREYSLSLFFYLR